MMERNLNWRKGRVFALITGGKMGFFSDRRKQKALAAEREHEALMKELSKLPCERAGGKHLYRDFPPYTVYDWNGSHEPSYIFLKEPYVCVYCGKRKDVELEKWTYREWSFDNFLDEYHNFQKRYDSITKPHGVVEDMVNDAIMLDREKLKCWDQIHGYSIPAKEIFEFKIDCKDINSDYRVMDPKEIKDETSD